MNRSLTLSIKSLNNLHKNHWNRQLSPSFCIISLWWDNCEEPQICIVFPWVKHGLKSISKLFLRLKRFCKCVWKRADWEELASVLQRVNIQRHTFTEVHHSHSSGLFPDSSVGKESAYDAGDPCSIPGSGRSPGEGIGYPLQYTWASLVAQLVRNPPAVWETWVWSLGWEDPLEKWETTHSSILAWRISWTV